MDELLLTAGGTSLFQAAIAQSGTSYLVSTNLALPSLTGNSSQSNWNLLASQLGCTATPKLQCMTKAKSLDIKKVVSQNNLGFNPIFDGGATVVVDQTMTRTEGRAAKVPLLMGTNFAEGYSFDFSIAKLDAGTKLLLAAIIALYGGGRNDRDDSAGLLTQLGFNCVSRSATRNHWSSDMAYSDTASPPRDNRLRLCRNTNIPLPLQRFLPQPRVGRCFRIPRR